MLTELVPALSSTPAAKKPSQRSLPRSSALAAQPPRSLAGRRCDHVLPKVACQLSLADHHQGESESYDRHLYTSKKDRLSTLAIRKARIAV